MRNFNAIETSTVGNITFIQTNDGSSSLKIKGPETLVKDIKVEVVNGVLCLTDNNRRKNRNKTVDVVVSAPSLEAIDTDGVGIIAVKDGLKTNQLCLNCKGVGNIEISNLDCGELSVNLDGVGNVELSGKAATALYSLNGVGSIKAENLKVQDVKALSNGIGNLRCYAVKTIDLSLQGMGSISYKGNPKIVNVEKGGFGKIKKIK